VIVTFIVYIGLLEGRTLNEAEEFFEEIQNRLNNLKNKISNEIGPLLETMCERFCPKILKNEITKNLDEQIKIKEHIKGKFEGKELLWSLIKAPDDCTSLKQLFRGDSFNGRFLMQRYENIFACVCYLVNQAAEEDIRYLEIRVAPSGYLKNESESITEAITALLNAADFTSLYLYVVEKKFIWVNFITTLKRHKDPYTRAQEVASAIIYRQREIEKLKLDIIHPGFLYTWKPSKIVGVDLAGQEEGYPPGQFIEDFSPIFKVCSFITIHAGEETSPQYIWEAIYKLHANRIGHALSIAGYPSLMELLSDTQVCIELCPTSNEKTGFSGGKKEKYPFFRYLLKGLSLTINTDDRGILKTTLSDEYVKAAEFFYFSEENTKKLPLTKWEILKIIKAGFDNMFINREEKRELLKWVEEEIYQKILHYYEIEPIYSVDKSEVSL